jgi:threonine aldolase
MTADDVHKAIRNYRKVMFGGFRVLSITQTTETGTVYTPSELHEICSVARQAGMLVHMDGARLANAVASLANPKSKGSKILQDGEEVAGLVADLTWRAGIDCLSLGASKNGTFAADAVVFFDVEKLDTSAFSLLMKRTGHDISKKRFMSAQLEAYLQDNLWLTLAGQANSLAQKLAGGIEELHTAYPQVSLQAFLS